MKSHSNLLCQRSLSFTAVGDLVLLALFILLFLLFVLVICAGILLCSEFSCRNYLIGNRCGKEHMPTSCVWIDLVIHERVCALALPSLLVPHERSHLAALYSALSAYTAGCGASSRCRLPRPSPDQATITQHRRQPGRRQGASTFFSFFLAFFSAFSRLKYSMPARALAGVSEEQEQGQRGPQMRLPLSYSFPKMVAARVLSSCSSPSSDARSCSGRGRTLPSTK